MALIYRTSDRIPLNVGGLVVEISPLTLEQKTAIQSEVVKGDIGSSMRGARLAVKYAVKSISGVETADGEPYTVELIDNVLSDQCVDDLFNMEQSTNLALISLNLLSGIPKDFVDPNTGKRIEGVSAIKKEKSGKKNK